MTKDTLKQALAIMEEASYIRSMRATFLEENVVSIQIKGYPDRKYVNEIVDSINAMFDTFAIKIENRAREMLMKELHPTQKKPIPHQDRPGGPYCHWCGENKVPVAGGLLVAIVKGTTDDQEQEKMLDECLDADSGLTGWEMDFIDNLDQSFRERPLSEKQVEILIRINVKAIS